MEFLKATFRHFESDSIDPNCNVWDIHGIIRINSKYYEGEGI